MKIVIIRNYEDVEIELYDLQFWNRRLFCKGDIDNKTYKFISTEGFENLLIKIEEGEEYEFNPKEDIKYKFELNRKFNPYTSEYVPVRNELSGNNTRSYFSRLQIKAYVKVLNKPRKYRDNIVNIKDRKFKRITYEDIDIRTAKTIKKRKYVSFSSKDTNVTLRKVKFKTDEFIERKYIKPIKDVGPNDFSGDYKLIQSLGPLIDNMFFETVDFDYPEFDLWKYQNNENYRMMNYSHQRNIKPKLIKMSGGNLFSSDDPQKIIHAVRKSEDENNVISYEDFFNTNILIKIFDFDAPTRGGSTFRRVLKETCDNSNYTRIKMVIEFISYQKYLKKIIGENDKWIHILFDTYRRNRKYELRHFFEYKMLIKPWLISGRSRPLDPEFKAAKRGGLWGHRFVLHSEITPGEFTLAYYRNDTPVNELETLFLINTKLTATPLFHVKLQYDFDKKRLMIDGYENKYKLSQDIVKYTSISHSITVSNILANLDKNGKIEMKLSKTKMRLYIAAETLINLYDLFETFGSHVGKVRDNLKLEYVRTKVLNEIFEFDFYSITKVLSLRSGLLEINDHPLDLNEIAVTIYQAIDFIVKMKDEEYSTKTHYKNMKEHGIDVSHKNKMGDRSAKIRTWYSDANKLILFASNFQPDEYVPTLNEWSENAKNSIALTNSILS
jgi:hypothetical protein